MLNSWKCLLRYWHWDCWDYWKRLYDWFSESNIEIVRSILKEAVGPNLVSPWIQKQDGVMRRCPGNTERGWVWADGGEVREAVRRRSKQVGTLDFH